MGTPEGHMDTRLNEAVWAKGIRNVPYHIAVPLLEDEDLPNKLYTVVGYLGTVTTVKILQLMWMRMNH